MYFEVQASLDLVSQDFCNSTVEICEDLHGKLRLDTAVIDEIVERIGERKADTVSRSAVS